MLKKDVVGVISPKRNVDLKKLHNEKDVPFDKAMARAVDFIINPVEAHIEKNGFIEVKSCGAGILLISRECITKMADCCPDIIDQVYHKKLPYAKDFEVFLMPFNKVTAGTSRMSEDISFCHRWVEECKGKIYANIDSNIKHVGTQVVESRYKNL